MLSPRFELKINLLPIRILPSCKDNNWLYILNNKIGQYQKIRNYYYLHKNEMLKFISRFKYAFN